MERLLLLRIVVENRRGFEFSFFLKPIRKTRINFPNLKISRIIISGGRKFDLDGLFHSIENYNFRSLSRSRSMEIFWNYLDLD